MGDDTNVGKTYKPWQFKPGNPGGPGRTPGKTMKDYSREFLAAMTPEERHEFLAGLDKIDIWKMAEGNPDQSGKQTVEINPTPLLNALRHNDSNPQDSGNEKKD